jgi:hypothetical protein
MMTIRKVRLPPAPTAFNMCFLETTDAPMADPTGERMTAKPWVMLVALVTLLGMDMAVTGCAGGPQSLPVTNPSQRLEFDAFSILPPTGEDWSVINPAVLRQQIPDLLVLFSKTVTPPSRFHTVTATVRGGRLPNSAGSRTELLQQLARNNFVQTEQRYRPVSFNISPDQTLAPDCLRYDGVIEDRGVPGYQGSVFMWDQHGFVCLHPYVPEGAIDIQYSQRWLQGEQPLLLEAEGEPFLRSLVFKQLPGHQSP